jgi:hypothetical protein
MSAEVEKSDAIEGEIVRMNPEIRALWSGALRSGKYEQGTGWLNRDGRYCCLGVLCELAVEAGIAERRTAGEFNVSGYAALGLSSDYEGEKATLPAVVANWAGLPSANPPVEYQAAGEPPRLVSLAELNDGTMTDVRKHAFDEIADFIDAQL